MTTNRSPSSVRPAGRDSVGAVRQEISRCRRGKHIHPNRVLVVLLSLSVKKPMASRFGKTRTSLSKTAL